MDLEADRPRVVKEVARGVERRQPDGNRRTGVPLRGAAGQGEGEKGEKSEGGSHGREDS